PASPSAMAAVAAVATRRNCWPNSSASRTPQSPRSRAPQWSECMSQFNSPARWYLIQTKPRQEARAEEHLQRQNFECYRPLKSGEPKKRTPKVASEEELFPGYLFIRMDQVHDNWYPIRSTRGVARIVTFGGHPVPVQDELIEQIRRRLH